MTEQSITNEEFEMHPWRETEVGNHTVHYYVIHNQYERTSNLYIRTILKTPSFRSIDEQTAMSEVYKIKNYIIHEGYLDEEMEGTPENSQVMIYSIYVYEKHNVIKEKRIDRFFNWLKGWMYR